MDSLDSVRHLSRLMTLIGVVLIAMSVAMGVSHYGFGVPVYDRISHQPESELVTSLVVLAFAGGGTFSVRAGRAILRAAKQRHLKN